MDTNSMNLISTLWDSEKWKRASTEWCDVGVGEWECESRVVGGTPVSLLVSQDFIISSPLLRVLSLWLASGHWRVCCPDCLQSRAQLSDFTFQHIPATVDSRKVHGCDLGMMAPGFEDDPILHCDSQFLMSWWACRVSEGRSEGNLDLIFERKCLNPASERVEWRYLIQQVYSRPVQLSLYCTLYTVLTAYCLSLGSVGEHKCCNQHCDNPELKP